MAGRNINDDFQLDSPKKCVRDPHILLWIKDRTDVAQKSPLLVVQRSQGSFKKLPNLATPFFKYESRRIWMNKWCS